MISSDRFELALEKLKGSDWERFERLASAFLAVEFPNLRTMAAPSGDGGRDAELYSASPTVWLQYSTQKDWKAKIHDSLLKLLTKSPTPTVLIYVTNKRIGALGDSQKVEFASKGLHLDIRDRSWFIERLQLSPSHEKAAEELATIVVDPLLERKGIISSTGTPLNREESHAALVYLEMQWRDQSGAKGLTKSCFEALVKAALRGSNPERRISLEDIYNRVHTMVPKHSIHQLKQYVDSAINRLLKNAIRHYPGDNTYCLSFEYIQTIKDSAAGVELLRERFVTEIKEDVERVAPSAPNTEIIVDFVVAVIERYLFELGEQFAAAVANDKEVPINENKLESIIVSLINADIVVAGRSPVNFIIRIVKDVLFSPSDAVAEYVKLASDSYTLLAFLAETPDVQKSTQKLFSHGEIWADTTALLPLFAEHVLPENRRPFTRLFKQANSIGINLFVTPGIIEEIERHFNRCNACDRSNDWSGKIPYIYQRYIMAGKAGGGFRDWSEQFYGQVHPERDIADFLLDEFGIQVEPINRFELKRLHPEVVNSVVEFWNTLHGKRRSEPGDEIIAKRLAEHDIENYLCVLDKRQGNPGKSGYGFGSWWLTLDFSAPKVAAYIKQETGINIFSPLISLDFLLRYLVFGPRRDAVNLGNTRIFSDTLWDVVPNNLIAIAREIRQQNATLPEKIIQRKIRDELDLQRAEIGPIHLGGLEKVEDTINSMA